MATKLTEQAIEGLRADDATATLDGIGSGTAHAVRTELTTATP